MVPFLNQAQSNAWFSEMHRRWVGVVVNNVELNLELPSLQQQESTFHQLEQNLQQKTMHANNLEKAIASITNERDMAVRVVERELNRKTEFLEEKKKLKEEMKFQATTFEQEEKQKSSKK